MLKRLAGRFVLFAFGCSLLSACGGLPPQDELRAALAGYQLPALPAADKAMVYVVRPSTFGRDFAFKVFLDSQAPPAEVGHTLGGQYIYFEVAPGEHRIYSKVDKWADTAVVAQAGETVFLLQDPEMGAVTFNNRLLRLSELEGRYYVKTLGEGSLRQQLPPPSEPLPLTPPSTAALGELPAQFGIVEVQPVSQAEGAGVSQAFLGYFLAGLREALVSAGVAGRVVERGARLTEADAANAAILEVRLVSYKENWYGIIVNCEARLYRRSDHALLKVISTEVGAKSSPLNTDQNVGENTGKKTAYEIKKAMPR